MNMAKQTSAQGMEDLTAVYQTFFFDLPLVGAKRGLGMNQEQEKEERETVWRGYDAWVRLSTTTVDNLYRMPLFGEIVARSLGVMLRWQRLSHAMVRASFAWLWPAVGLPTAATIQGLRAEVQDLREELHSSAMNFLLTAPLHTNGTAATPPLVSPREALHSSPAVYPLPGKEQAALPTDFSEYFEPVGSDAHSVSGLEHMQGTVCTTDLDEYFEPVERGGQLVPRPKPGEHQERKVITQPEALPAERPGTKHSPHPPPLYPRAGRQVAHKKAARVNTLR
jgi:hypothetical protein